MAEGGSETPIQNDSTGAFNVKVRWAIPQRLNQVTFIGKDILAVAYDIYIIFINFKNNVEKVYVANSRELGDGVDVIAGHKSKLFAFAEKTNAARIFIMVYPSFQILAEMKDTDVNRYKGLCLMEMDLVAGVSGFPNYIMTVWSWRTNQKLISVPTGVVRRSQIFTASRMHMLACQCWGEGLTVWEVAQCYKKCLLMKRSKEEMVGWEISDPPLVGVCWSNEGLLYAVDAAGVLYHVVSDGIGMVTVREWAEELPLEHKPKICAFGNGLLIYGPDNFLRALKKTDNKWKVVFTFAPHDPVEALVSNSSCDCAAMWTESGLVYKLAGETEDKIEVTPMAYKQRFIKKIQLIAPEYKYLATMNESGMLCIYDNMTGSLLLMRIIDGTDVSFEASPVEPVLAVLGCSGEKYGVALYLLEVGEQELTLQQTSRLCLTHQLLDRVTFSDRGRELLATAMSAGHVFILKVATDFKLSLVRYSELGRGLADCFLMKVGESMRAFSLVLFSDKYPIGERIICINAETGKDNKFAGKMHGPYSRLLPLRTADHMLAMPHLSRSYHVLRLFGEKGVTVSVKMGPIVDSGHDIKQFDGFFTPQWLLTTGFDGNMVLRKPDATSVNYELKVCVSHRYSGGVRAGVVDASASVAAVLAGGACCVLGLRAPAPERARDPLRLALLDTSHRITCVAPEDKTYLELQEEKKVREEALDCRRAREEVVSGFVAVQRKVVALLEENIAAPPLHQLSLSEFNLHQEHRRERKLAAEREREEIRLNTEARIRAQDKVTLWIKTFCWDSMLSPRVKIFAIFSHYQVENYPVLPTQRDKWPELNQTEALRLVEMEADGDVFRPWEEAQPAAVLANLAASRLPRKSGAIVGPEPSTTTRELPDTGLSSQVSVMQMADHEEEEEEGQPYVLSGSNAHLYVQVPPIMIPQTLSFSFLQMNWLQHIVKLTVQNMRLWYNKQFDELMALKKREVGLVEERNSRLRFIIEELNKLSDLRGSFHHLMIDIQDPKWMQDEQPIRLTKVEPEECSIEPYISPSQIVIVPPDPGPKDDFRERALIDMMDGVLEKLWHEEIKKPIPMPQCMLDKDPEHFNEDDLRLVFEYEAKVAFRNEERDKYRKMLHAEYAKLSQVLNEGIVRFNNKVKEMWLLKLQVDSVNGQENLNLMRLRRTNLDRLEMAEKLEDMRAVIAKNEAEVEVLTKEIQIIQEQGTEVQAMYDNLGIKDKYMERTFKNHFADLSPIIVDQCYKFFRKRPKWQQRATMVPVVLYELAGGILAAQRPAMLHPDCMDYYKGVDQLDQLSNMPTVMDEGLWTTMCKLRRAKIENEIRMRGVALEMGLVNNAQEVWGRALQARRAKLAQTHDDIQRHRELVELTARNRTVQLVLPAGQVEIITTGRMEDFEDAALIPREDIETINNLILKVGALKLRMMRRQMEFRKGILAKEWEHAQMMMKLRHMRQELHSYERLRIPKELQLFLKNKELGYTEEYEFVRMEKAMEATKLALNRGLQDQIHRVEELQMKNTAVQVASLALDQLITNLHVKVSEKRLNEDPLKPIRVRRVFKKRMDTLVSRSQLIREVQANHTTIVMLQTELELLRLKTYPTLACFRTYN